MINVDDHVLLSSVLLNILAFLYGLIFLISKTLYRNRKFANEYACGCNESKMTTFCHTVAKSFLNVSSGTGLLGTSLFVLATSRVCSSPFLANDKNTRLAVTLTLTMCVFDLVLTLLTETITIQNIHEIPLYGVKTLLCISIIIKDENAISGVIVLFMFGSIVADQLVNLYSLSEINNNERESKGRRWLHLFRLSMHVLCNFTFPIIALFTTAWFSEQQQFFNMATSSIIVFFFAATFFVVCNGWRFVCAWRQLIEVAKNEEAEREKTVRMTAWCANTATAMVSSMKDINSLVLSPDGVYDNVVEIDENDSYNEVDDSKIDIPVQNQDVVGTFEDINLID